MEKSKEVLRTGRRRLAAVIAADQPSDSPEHSQLAKENTQLATENQRLRDLLADRASANALKQGYLFKYRPQATGSLWANAWEPRYLILRDKALVYYKSEQHVHFPPRGYISLDGAWLDLEGLKRRRYYTFSIRDDAGVTLARLSTEVQSEFVAWVEALEAAGCLRRSDDDDSTRSGLTPSNSQTSRATSAVPEDTGDEADSGASPRAGHHGRRHHSQHRDAMEAFTPVHMAVQWSLLSRQRIGFLDQSGLVTLLCIVVAATNFRLILENMIKYGLRFNPILFVRAALTPSENLALGLCWPALVGFCLNALFIEKLANRCLTAQLRADDAAAKRDQPRTARKRQAPVTEAFILLLNVVNIMASLVVPSTVIHVTFAEPLPSFALTMFASVLWLKLVSYAHVNWALRRARRQRPGRRCAGEAGSGVEPFGAEQMLVYPQNVTLGNLAYFLAAPTLCYQLSYPCSPTPVRPRWLIRRLITLGVALGMMLFFVEQYIEPTIDNSLRPLQEMDWLRMVERVLKLSLPTLYFWLAMFYSLFDLWLNILAEATRFGDREFYKEWWNATTVGEYWRLWNMPVHKWMLRHVYFPAIRMGLPKFHAGIVVFFVSAVFHELLVAVPLHMLRGWAFWGIMGQVPLMYLTELLKRKFNSDRIGNVVFWVSFCFLGQPLAEILYFHDWRKLHGPAGL